MKRIFTKIAVVAASAALCLSIAACGSSDSTSSAPTASAANDATASVPVVSAPATTEATASAAASSAVSQTLSGTYALDVDDAYLAATGKNVSSLSETQKAQAIKDAAITATFSADGSFTAATSSKSISGTYTFDGTTVSLTANGASMQYAYDAANDTLSVDYKGITAVFKHQA